MRFTSDGLLRALGLVLIVILVMLLLGVPMPALAQDGAPAVEALPQQTLALFVAGVVVCFQLLLSMITAAVVLYHHRLLTRGDRQEQEIHELHKARTATLEQHVRQLQADHVTRTEVRALSERLEAQGEMLAHIRGEVATHSQMLAHIERETGTLRHDVTSILKILTGARK